MINEGLRPDIESRKVSVARQVPIFFDLRKRCRTLDGIEDFSSLAHFPGIVVRHDHLSNGSSWQLFRKQCPAALAFYGNVKDEDELVYIIKRGVSTLILDIDLSDCVRLQYYYELSREWQRQLFVCIRSTSDIEAVLQSDICQVFIDQCESKYFQELRQYLPRRSAIWTSKAVYDSSSHEDQKVIQTIITDC